MSNLDFLCARLLKAKYFPTTSFLNAPPYLNPSFTWKSILARKEILSRGAIWKIGSGVTTRIWEDPWIPLPNRFHALTRSNMNPNMFFVS